MMDSKIDNSDRDDRDAYQRRTFAVAEPADGKTWFTIGELADEFDVTLRSLRFYEDKHLLAPLRDGRTRIYSRRDRARLRLILLGKRVGLSLLEIQELLDSYSKKDRGARQLKLACQKFSDQEKLLQSQRAEIDRSLQELSESLKAMRSRVDDGH